MRKKWVWGLTFCKIFANVIYSTAYSAWLSVAMVAVSRSVTIVNPGKETIFSSRRNRLITFLFIRIFAFLPLIPDNIGVSKMFIIQK